MGRVYKYAGLEAAKIAGKLPQMDATADRVMLAVLAAGGPHFKTGQFAKSIKTANVRGRNGVRDRIVYSTDPNLWSIEFGHWYVNRKTKLKSQWVQGLFILRNTAARLGGG
jgi:hypothetical protein